MKMRFEKPKGNIVMASKQKSIERKIIYLVIFLIATFIFLPFLLFGENSIITIHDSLDIIIPSYKMFHDNGLFFKFDVPTNGFSGMSTLYFSLIGYTFQSTLYWIFNDFTAYVLSYYFSIFFGFISMYILLKKTLGISSILSVFMAICYAILPVQPNWNIAVSTLPIIIAIFYYFAFNNSNVFSWKVLFLIFFPFFSFFAAIGFFVLGFWFLGIVVLLIKNKKINPNLLVGFILLCIGYILVDLRLFYVMFILKTPLNRTIYSLRYSNNIVTQIKTFLRQLISYGAKGHYHATSFQLGIILPITFILSLSCLITLIRRIRDQSGTINAKIKAALAKTNIKVKQLFILDFIVIAFCCIAALYYSGLLSGFITSYIPILSGFNWGRVWIFNRVLWYVIFVLCLQIILEIDNTSFIKKIKLPPFLPRLIVWVLICLQLGYIASRPVNYNDQVKTWFNEIIIKTGIAKKILPNKNFNSFISYKEFFAEDLFNRIKNDISYSGEMVVAFGYHPSVLMYNGFNCIDGYNGAYPLSYMVKFRTLIAPELEVNQQRRYYYDGGGIRMYLYNSKLEYVPTRNKNTSPVELNIDMDVFKNDFNGVYILSRAEISNSDALGLDLIKRYYDEESIYTIYLYRCSNI